jgi:hypothetical protein
MSSLTMNHYKIPTSLLGVVGLSMLALGCNRTFVTNNYTQSPNDAGPGETSEEPNDTSTAGDADAATDAGIGSSDAGAAQNDSGLGDAGAPPPGPAADAGVDASDAGSDAGYLAPGDLAIDVFGTYENVYRFVVSDEQLEQMNQRYGGGGPIFLMEPEVKAGNPYGDIYSPGGGAGDKTFVDHMYVTTPAGDTADFGKVQVNLVGESTGRPWTDSSLPNLKIDTNEFTKGNRLGVYEHVRFNNAVVGSIFREKFTFDFYNDLGYPAPRTSYAWVQSSVWGEEEKIPYVLVESYKRSFCKLDPARFGGECPNMWEFPGDFGSGRFSEPDTCQFEECDDTHVKELDDAVALTPPGPGFKEALSPWLDWARFHEFQCLSWIFATGDDALHNTNNLVVAERPDGMFQLLPYSVDISFGQDWYRYVPLAGQNTLSRGCQEDEQCWADTIATCETLLNAFVEADPVKRLDDLYAQLEGVGMLRAGDEGRYQDIRGYIEERLIDLPLELEASREDPYAAYCKAPQIMCGDYCAMPQDCYLCNDNGGGPVPVPEPLPIRAADVGIALPDVGEGEDPVPVGDAGVEPEPNPCLPQVDYYGAK